jgi:hypothetical protein
MNWKFRYQTTSVWLLNWYSNDKTIWLCLKVKSSALAVAINTPLRVVCELILKGQSFSSSKDATWILWNGKTHFAINRHLPLDPIRSEFNPLNFIALIIFVKEQYVRSSSLGNSSQSSVISLGVQISASALVSHFHKPRVTNYTLFFIFSDMIQQNCDQIVARGPEFIQCLKSSRI